MEFHPGGAECTGWREGNAWIGMPENFSLSLPSETPSCATTAFAGFYKLSKSLTKGPVLASEETKYRWLSNLSTPLPFFFFFFAQNKRRQTFLSPYPLSDTALFLVPEKKKRGFNFLRIRAQLLCDEQVCALPSFFPLRVCFL